MWRCQACGAYWPCQPARLALLIEYRHDRTALLIYLGGLMVEAGEQLGHATGRHERFLGWARVRGGTMFHVNHEPGAQSTPPTRSPCRPGAVAGTPAARAAGRPGDPVDGSRAGRA